MKSLINALADSVLSKNIDSITEQALKTLCDQYPYASAIQLLYAQKLKQSDQDVFNPQLQKTLLYYNNPLLIHHIINHNNQKNIIIKDDEKLILLEKTEAVSNDKIIPEKKETDEYIDDPGEEEADDNMPELPQFKIEAIDPSKAELSFTPYHTIDYFAAQGIKLGEEKNSDRFNTQLKSFTDWLKHMKRLPGVTVKTEITQNEEKTIEQMAQQSVSGENADTEAMAEVWIKQNDIKKAIDIYKKLSLQNPAKSAYFAAKIDYLKKST